MATPLSFFVPQMALYGFTSAYFTGGIGLGTTAVLLLWVFIVSVAQYRDGADIEPDRGVAGLIIDLNLRVPVSVLFGVLLGLLYNWAFQLVPLLTWDLWTVGWRFLPPGVAADDHASRGRSVVFAFDSAFTVLFFGFVALVAAVEFLVGAFQPELSGGSSTAVGLVLLLTGLALVIWVLVTWWRSPLPGDWLNSLCALALGALALTPLLFNLLVNIRPLNQLVFHIGLILTVTIFAALHVRFFKNIDSLLLTQLHNDVRAAPSQSSATRIVGRWFVLWLNLAIIYTAAGIATEVSDDSLGTTLLVVGVTALLMAVFALVFGYFRRSAWPVFYIVHSDQHAQHFLPPPAEGARPKQDSGDTLPITTQSRAHAPTMHARRSPLATNVAAASDVPPPPPQQQTNYGTLAALQVNPRNKNKAKQ